MAAWMVGKRVRRASLLEPRRWFLAKRLFQRLLVGLQVLGEARGNLPLALDLLVEGVGDGRDVEAEILGDGAHGALRGLLNPDGR